MLSGMCPLSLSYLLRFALPGRDMPLGRLLRCLSWRAPVPALAVAVSVGCCARPPLDWRPSRPRRPRGSSCALPLLARVCVRVPLYLNLPVCLWAAPTGGAPLPGPASLEVTGAVDALSPAAATPGPEDPSVAVAGAGDASPSDGPVASAPSPVVHCLVFAEGFRTEHAILEGDPPGTVDQLLAQVASRSARLQQLAPAEVLPTSPQLGVGYASLVLVPTWIPVASKCVVVLDMSLLHGPTYAKIFFDLLSYRDLEREVAVHFDGLWHVYAPNELFPLQAGGSVQATSGDVFVFIPRDMMAPREPPLGDLVCRPELWEREPQNLHLEAPTSYWLVLCSQSTRIIRYEGPWNLELQALIAERMNCTLDTVCFSRPALGSSLSEVVHQGLLFERIAAADFRGSSYFLMGVRSILGGLSQPHISLLLSMKRAFKFRSDALVLTPGVAPATFSLPLLLPCTPQRACEALDAVRQDSLQDTYSHLIVASPQPDEHFATLIAVPKWATGCCVVVVDSRELDGRLFSVRVDPDLMPGSLLTQIGLRPDVGLRLMHRGSIQDANCRLALRKGRLDGWVQPLVAPSGPLQHAFCFLTDAWEVTIHHAVLVDVPLHLFGSGADFRHFATAFLRGDVDRTSVFRPFPRIADLCVLGQSCKEVVIVTEALPRLPCPPAWPLPRQVPYILDLRPLLRPIVWRCALNGDIDFDALLAEFGPAPSGFYLSAEGGSSRCVDGKAIIQLLPGQVVQLEFCDDLLGEPPEDEQEGSPPDSSGDEDSSDSESDGDDADNPPDPAPGSRNRSRSRLRNRKAPVSRAGGVLTAGLVLSSHTLGVDAAARVGVPDGRARFPSVFDNRFLPSRRGWDCAFPAAGGFTPLPLLCPSGLAATWVAALIWMAVLAGRLLHTFSVDGIAVSLPHYEMLLMSLEVVWVCFTVLTPGYMPDSRMVRLRMPATFAEAATAVRESRGPEDRDTFPHVVDASPQPITGHGVFVCCPHWQGVALVACLDLLQIDGRVFAARIPHYCDRYVLLRAASLEASAPVDIYVGYAEEPLPDGVDLHMFPGETVRFVLRGRMPDAAISLAQMLADPPLWRGHPPLPIIAPDGLYCVVSDRGSHPVRVDQTRPLSFRQTLAEHVQVVPSQLRLFPSTPRVPNMAIAGRVCRTVTAAAADTSLRHPGTWHLALLDGRIIGEDWTLLQVVDGLISGRDLLDDLRQTTPAGWLPTVNADFDLDPHGFLSLGPGQVVVVDYYRDVPADQPQGFGASFAVYVPDRLPFSIDVVLRPGLSLREALAHVNACRSAPDRALFPGLLALCFGCICLQFLCVRRRFVGWAVGLILCWSLLPGVAAGRTPVAEVGCPGSCVRPLPTPCRGVRCASGAPQQGSGGLVTLLEEARRHPDFRAFLDARALLQTLVEHFATRSPRRSNAAPGAPSDSEIAVPSAPVCFDLDEDDAPLQLSLCEVVPPPAAAVCVPRFDLTLGTCVTPLTNAMLADLCRFVPLGWGLVISALTPEWEVSSYASELAGLFGRFWACPQPFSLSLADWFRGSGEAFRWVPHACWSRLYPGQGPYLTDGVIRWGDAEPPSLLTGAEVMEPFLRAAPCTDPPVPSGSARGKPAAFECVIVSFNALSLVAPGGGEAHGGVSGLHGATGRIALLDGTLAAQHAFLVGLQEAVVLHADHTRLCVRLAFSATQVCVFVMHAPHCGHGFKSRREWWLSTEAICAKVGFSEPWVFMADANCRVGDLTSPYIGPLHADAHDDVGELFHALLRKCDVWLPSTFSECFSGHGGTLMQKRSGAFARNDFVGLPMLWRQSGVTGRVEPTISAGHVIVDHLAVLASCSLRLVSPPCRAGGKRIDAAALLNPENSDKVRQVLLSVPPVPWDTNINDHAAVLVDSLYVGLVDKWPLGACASTTLPRPRQRRIGTLAFSGMPCDGELRGFAGGGFISYDWDADKTALHIFLNLRQLLRMRLLPNGGDTSPSSKVGLLRYPPLLILLARCAARSHTVLVDRTSSLLRCVPALRFRLLGCCGLCFSKERGSTLAAAQRGILLQPVLGKALHRAFRQLPAERFEACAAPLQIGGRRGLSYELGHFMSRNFLHAARHHNLSAALVFSDLAAAYYTVVREVVVGAGADSDPLQRVASTLKLPPEDLQQVIAYATSDPVLQPSDGTSLLHALMAEVHSDTWFHLSGDPTLVRTSRGTRPGSSIADVAFNLLFQKVLEKRSPAAEKHLPSFMWSGRRELTQAMPAHSGSVKVDVGDIVYADDHAACVTSADAPGLSRAVACVLGSSLDAVAAHGLSANFGAWSSLDHCVTAIHRQMLRIRAGQDQHWTHDEVFAACDASDAADLLALERLRFLGRLLRHGPDAAWALLQNSPPALEAFHSALDWFYAAIHLTCPLHPFRTHWEDWHEVIRWRPKLWQGWLKRAALWHRGARALRASWSRFVRTAWCARPLEVEDNANGQHGCLQCCLSFENAQAWASHAHLKHGYRTKQYRFARGLRCQACGTVFSSVKRHRLHLGHSRICLQAVESGSSDLLPCVLGDEGHLQCRARAGRGTAHLPPLFPEVAPDLLRRLRELEDSTDEGIFDVVRDAVEPFAVLRRTLEAWVGELPAGTLREAASDVLLCFTVDLLCTSAAHPGAHKQHARLDPLVLPLAWQPRPAGLPGLLSGRSSVFAASVTGVHPEVGALTRSFRRRLPAWILRAR
ncbi:unnamed protein product [Symbiodinium sp. CCMP2592]|nr:unnamed protein product [Symbiodinium sp. CCMP2592]